MIKMISIMNVDMSYDAKCFLFWVSYDDIYMYT